MAYLNADVKASPLPRIGLIATLAFGIAGTVMAQDSVTLKSGQKREGKIVGTSAGSVRLQVGGATAGISLADVKEIRMAAPPEFDAAVSQLASGDAKGAVVSLKKLNADYAGLPAAWTQRSAAMLGDALLAEGDTAGAKEVYTKFTETYPEAKVLANLGMARLAVDAGQYDEAAKLLEPVLAASAEAAFPAPEDGPGLSQGHYLMGRIREAKGEHQMALEEYLKASAVFPFDRTAAATAQTRADALRAEHAGLIAP